VVDVARTLPRFRAFPDDIGIALERDKPFAHVGPILKLFDGYMVAGLAAGTAGEERPRDIDHVGRALLLIEERRTASRTETAGRLRLSIFEASDAALTLRHARMFTPTPDIGRIGGAVCTAACGGVIVPGPKSGKVDLQLDRTAKAAARDAPTRWFWHRINRRPERSEVWVLHRAMSGEQHSDNSRQEDPVKGSRTSDRCHWRAKIAQLAQVHDIRADKCADYPADVCQHIAMV